MQYIIHHNDDDGRCAAAIIYNEICMMSGIDMKKENFFEYTHGGPIPDIDVTKLTDNDVVYIVDLALDDVIYGIIKKIRKSNSNIKIVHIDHHKTTCSYLIEREDDVMNTVHRFYRMGLSASMLCWVYCSMMEEEREHNIQGAPDIFDFTEGYSHVGFNIGKSNERDIRIPMIVRFVNDWDVWNHEIPGSKAFHFGFGIVNDKHPMNKLWSDLLYAYNDHSLVEKYIIPGEAIVQYQTAEYEHMLKHAFEYTLDGVKMLCLNASGSSLVFGDKIKDYPAVCLFQYHGDKGLWHYSLYSSDEGVDVSDICKKLGGGGHAHAAGFTSAEYIFI